MQSAKPAKTRIYVVSDKSGNSILVEAISPAQAIAFVAKSEYTSSVATQTELIQLVQNGTTVIRKSAKEA